MLRRGEKKFPHCGGRAAGKSWGGGGGGQGRGRRHLSVGLGAVNVPAGRGRGTHSGTARRHKG